MRSDEAGTKPSKNYAFPSKSMFRDVTDHKDRNVEAGLLLDAPVQPNTNGFGYEAVTESEDGMWDVQSSSLLLMVLTI